MNVGEILTFKTNNMKDGEFRNGKGGNPDGEATSFYDTNWG